jgi:hypothetical protein
MSIVMSVNRYLITKKAMETINNKGWGNTRVVIHLYKNKRVVSMNIVKDKP